MERLAALLAASLLLAGCTAAGSGGMRASRPTAARKAAAVPVWPETKNLFVGAGFIPPGAFAPPRTSPGRCKHRPLQRFVITQGRSFPVGRGIFPGSAGRAFTPAAHWRFKMETFAPPRGAAGWGHPALRTPGGLRLSGFAGHVRKVCRGGAYPSRGALPYREHPGEGHGPPLRTGTDATAIRLVRNTKFIRRGGFHIRPGPCVAAGFPGRSPA